MMAKRWARHENIVYIDNIAGKVHTFEAGDKEPEEFISWDIDKKN